MCTPPQVDNYLSFPPMQFIASLIIHKTKLSLPPSPSGKSHDRKLYHCQQLPFANLHMKTFQQVVPKYITKYF